MNHDTLTKLYFFKLVQIIPQINTIIYTNKLLGGGYMKDMVKISDLNQTFYTKDGDLEVLKNFLEVTI